MSAPLINAAFEQCPKCHGTGWEHVAGKGVRECDCKRSMHQEQLLKNARIPSRYLTCSLDNYIPQGSADSASYKSQFIAKKLAAGFIENFPDVNVGLLFMGPCGIGKTHLAIATLIALIGNKGVQCLFYDFRDLLKEIQNTYRPESEITESQIISSVVNTEVLLIDELGAWKPTDWARDTMTYIVTQRYNENRLTLFTTNYLDDPITRNEESLTDRIGVRLRSRLFDMSQAVLMSGEDFRRKRSELRNPKLI